jgi:hypothetical protein
MNSSLRSTATTSGGDLQRWIRELTAPDQEACAAAWTLIQQQGTSAVPALLRAAAELVEVAGMKRAGPSADSARADSLLAVLSVINALDPAAGVRAMRMTLADQSVQVRQAAITLLAAAGHGGILALEEALDAGSEVAQAEAAWALERLGSSDAVAALSRGLDSARSALQSACAHALFSIALRDPVPELRMAAPRLEELARCGATSPLPVRETCRQTLRQINERTLPHASLPIPVHAAAVEARHLPIPHPNSESEGGDDA